MSEVVSKVRILDEHVGGYKPHHYPWAFNAYKMQRQMDWHLEEVVFDEDVVDWSSPDKLTAPEKNLLTQIFRFFTQGDIDIADGYHKKYLPKFSHPEVVMMMSQFAAMENVHIEAYAALLEQVNMPEIEFSLFKDYKEMKDKHEYMFNLKSLGDEISDLALNIAVFSAFGEGLQLFSSFAMLLNFQRFNLMKGMCQIVTWSIRDESLHVEYMIRVFKTIMQEYPHIDREAISAAIYEACQKIVELEDKFIELAYAEGEVRGTTPNDMKLYARFIANRRLRQLGLNELYDIKSDPVPWLRDLLTNIEFTNFFENRATEYTKYAARGSYRDDVWGRLKGTSKIPVEELA